jgi:hypothetical protein
MVRMSGPLSWTAAQAGTGWPAEARRTRSTGQSRATATRWGSAEMWRMSASAKGATYRGAPTGVHSRTN